MVLPEKVRFRSSGESFKVDADFALRFMIITLNRYLKLNPISRCEVTCTTQGIGMLRTSIKKTAVPAHLNGYTGLCSDRSSSMQDDSDVYGHLILLSMNCRISASDWQVIYDRHYYTVITQISGHQRHPSIRLYLQCQLSNGGNGGDIGLTELIVPMAQVNGDNTRSCERNAPVSFKQCDAP